MTYPLPTLACTITPAGITAPGYSDIFGSLQASAQGIFGTDIYLDPDSQDGQWVGVIAQAISDSNNATIGAYQARSPLYATGVGLDSLVQVNGIARDAASASSCPVVVTGDVGFTIVAGVVQSSSDQTLWSLPATVTIPSGGSTAVTAVCQTLGAVESPIGALSIISNPQVGWASVDNTVTGSLGNPVQSDANLRQAQAEAVGAPAQSIDAGILGGVLQVAGVASAQLYDNDTNATDGNGIPAHTIAVVVGGAPAVQDIVNAIGSRKTPGCGTQGNTSGTYTDPIGLPKTINYWTLTPVSVQVTVNISAFSGYASSTAGLIASAVAAYLNTLAIGQTVYISKLYSPANLTGSVAIAATGLTQADLDALSATYSVSSILICAYPGTPIASDLAITYIEQAQGLAAHVSVVS
jgi:uncharacterized phage protein gp47/JayE